jgi:magnesium chelatase family protein
MDRIDIHIEVPAVPFEELSASSVAGTSSQQMRDDVVRARNKQRERFANSPVRYNAQMSSRQVREFCKLDKTCQQMLRHSVEDMGLSARAHDKILRVARTIADVADDDAIGEMHLAEAIGYRSLDRDLWV